PKVVVLTHYSNVTGAIAPIDEMSNLAKEITDAVVVIDAAQSAPHIRLNLSSLSADFVAFSGHKMLGPTGVGCLYGQQAALEKLNVSLWGGGMIEWVD